MLRQLAARLCGGEGQHVYRYATAWPVEMLLAQSWDTALLEEVGAAVADELVEFGVTLLLAPAITSTAIRCVAATLNITPRTCSSPAKWPPPMCSVCSPSPA